MIPGVHFSDARKLGHAGAAPGRPEIDEDDPASPVGGGECEPIDNFTGLRHRRDGDAIKFYQRMLLECIFDHLQIALKDFKQISG
jgi:hypothetical protein